MDYIEKLKTHPYISNQILVKRYSDPYNFVIIDNLFKEDVYKKICSRAPEYIKRQEDSHGQIGDTGLVYNAKIYNLLEKDLIDGFDFFNSKDWQNFISQLFDIKLNQHNAYSLHWHKGSKENPSKDGWPHADLSICSVVDDPKAEIKLIGDCEYADDTINRQPNTTKIMRSVAILYYFNNDNNNLTGGGTAIYKSYNKDSFFGEVKPINNRVFLFEICPESYHGYIGAEYDRTAIVHWFHSSPSYVVKRQEKLFRERVSKGLDFFEYWKKEDRWQLDLDPDYYDYFDSPFNEEFKK